MQTSPVTRNLVFAAAVGSFGLAVVFGLINSQVCVPCFSIFIGLLVGYLAARYEQPETDTLANRLGGQAGAAAGVGVVLGHLAGGLLGAWRIGLEGAQASMQAILRQLGATLPDLGGSPLGYYASTLACSGLFALVSVGLMALFGLAGARLWFGRSPFAGPPPDEDHPLRG